MVITVGELVRKSMQIIGALSTGETPQAAEMQDAITTLNGMIGSWNTENLIIQTLMTEEFPLVNGKQVYTMGPGGDFNTTRPLTIDMVQLHLTGQNDYFVPVTVLNQEQWAAIAVKSTTSSIPTKVFVQQNYPMSNVYVWPVPNAASSLSITSTKPIADFANASASADLAPGYFDALKYGLAIRLAPEYGRQPDEMVVALANEAKENIKRANITTIYMQSDAPIGAISGRFNILSGR